MFAPKQLGWLVVTAAVAAPSCSSVQAVGGDRQDGSEVALFDSSVVHEIELEFDQEDFDSMIESFTETGEKEWIDVTVTVDGTTYEHAGARLKGNSSLAGLGGGRNGGANRPGGSANTDEPESLPWLIRLNRFVDGQEHQGYEDIIIRSNGSATSLNEAVSLDLLDAAGLASQDAASTSFRINDGDAVLRLAIEHPADDEWQEANFEEDGALYKAESSGDWSYRGDDPDAYQEIFDQEGGSDLTDLAPLIEFLKFIDEADDATFAAELGVRLDVESFATYLAMMNLLANFDDIDGPGNNAYLWYDMESGRFTVVPWDLNLAFGGGPGGGGFGGRGPDAGAGQGLGRPNMDPPVGANLGGGRGPGGFSGRSNPLVERFLEVAEFESLYEDNLDSLRESLYATSTASDVLASWVETLTDQATDLVNEATIDAEADRIAAQVTE